MIAKAVIPVAGLGTRMRPISAAVPKALLPLSDSRARLRPVLHWICAEAASAGIDEVAIVVLPGQDGLLREYFAASRQAGDKDLPARIEFIFAEPRGFGYAVAQAEGFTGGGDFLLLLGDHVHVAPKGAPRCAAQVTSAHAQWKGAAMIGMQTVGPEELPRVGAAAGEPLGEGVYRALAVAEKPTPAHAEQNLRTADLPRGRFLAHAGIYAFTSEIFDCLRQVAARLPEGAELELATAQERLFQQAAGRYYLKRIDGRGLDTGTPVNYARAWESFRKP